MADNIKDYMMALTGKDWTVHDIGDGDVVLINEDGERVHAAGKMHHGVMSVEFVEGEGHGYSVVGPFLKAKSARLNRAVDELALKLVRGVSEMVDSSRSVLTESLLFLAYYDGSDKEFEGKLWSLIGVAESISQHMEFSLDQIYTIEKGRRNE